MSVEDEGDSGGLTLNLVNPEVSHEKEEKKRKIKGDEDQEQIAKPKTKKLKTGEKG